MSGSEAFCAVFGVGAVCGVGEVCGGGANVGVCVGCGVCATAKTEKIKPSETEKISDDFVLIFDKKTKGENVLNIENLPAELELETDLKNVCNTKKVK